MQYRALDCDVQNQDAQEADLRDLFGFFGSIRRIFLAKDKVTQHSKVGLTTSREAESPRGYLRFSLVLAIPC